MNAVKPHRNSRTKFDFVITIVALVASVAGLIYLWPHLMGDVTILELSEDLSAYSWRADRFNGTVASLHPYDFGIGDVENVVMRLEDEGAYIELIYDQLSLRYKPKVGDRVRVVGHIRRYGEITPEMLIASKIKQIK
jgi:hypothetical protein